MVTIRYLILACSLTILPSCYTGGGGGGGGGSGGGSGSSATITYSEWGCDPYASAWDDLFWFYVEADNAVSVWCELTGGATGTVYLTDYSDYWWGEAWGDSFSGDSDCDYMAYITVYCHAA